MIACQPVDLILKDSTTKSEWLSGVPEDEDMWIKSQEGQ